MLAYKLLKLRKDGSVGPLFINAKSRLERHVWMTAETFPTKGFAVRKGWHCCLEPKAPHLKLELASGERRQWWMVEIEDYEEYDRPESQGGTWLLANRMKLIAPLIAPQAIGRSDSNIVIEIAKRMKLIGRVES